MSAAESERRRSRGKRTSKVRHGRLVTKDKFRRLLDGNLVGIHHSNRDGTVYCANDAFLQMLGIKRKELNLEKINWRELTAPEDRNAVAEIVDRIFATGLPIIFEETYLRPDGKRIDAVVEAIPFGKGQDELITKVVPKDMQLKELHLIEAFKMSQDMLVISRKGDGMIMNVSESSSTHLGFSPRELIGRNVIELNLMSASELDKIHQIILAQGTVRDLEVSVRHRSGEVRHMLLGIRPIQTRGEDCFLTVARDITRRKRHEEQIRNLLDELNHRSRNLLTVVGAIAGQLSRTSNNLEEFHRRFSDRLVGLARSNDLLVREKAAPIRLRDLLEVQLSPFIDSKSERVSISGPDLVLHSDAVGSIGLVIHELATNAAKYGALSVTTGRIEVSWEIKEELVPPGMQMTWREIGGPPVQQPQTMGFGNAVTERIVGLALGGEAHTVFNADGVVWTLRAPADRMRLRDAMSEPVT